MLIVGNAFLLLIGCATAMLLSSVRMTADTEAEVTVRWKRRVVLLIAICLSATCSVLAVSTSEDGLCYRNGCAAATQVS